MHVIRRRENARATSGPICVVVSQRTVGNVENTRPLIYAASLSTSIPDKRGITDRKVTAIMQNAAAITGEIGIDGAIGNAQLTDVVNPSTFPLPVAGPVDGEDTARNR